MPNDLGQTFYQAANAPLAEALEHLNAGRIVPGLMSLHSEKLLEAWARGVGLVAAQSSCRPEQVKQIVPPDGLEDLTTKLDENLKQLVAYRDQLQRSLSVAPGVSSTKNTKLSSSLQRLASRYQLDRELFEALTHLATMAETLELMLSQAQESLSTDRKLAARIRRRLMIRVTIAVVAVVLVVGVSGWYAWSVHREKAAQARVQALIDAPDPCQVENVLEGDEAFATATQADAITNNLKRCKKKRAREKYEAACSSLASHLTEGKLDKNDRSFALNAAGLLDRVANHALTLDDLHLKDDILPCQDTPSGKRLWDIVANEIGASARLWGLTNSVSDHVRNLILADPKRWTARSRKSLSYHAETMAQRAIKSGQPEMLQEAREVCSLVRRLGLPLERNCRALKSLDSQ